MCTRRDTWRRARQWANGRKEGKGTLHLKDGDMFHGVWADGRISGETSPPRRPPCSAHPPAPQPARRDRHPLPPDRPGHARVRRGVCVEPGRHVDVCARTRPRRQPRQRRGSASPCPAPPSRLLIPAPRPTCRVTAHRPGTPDLHQTPPSSAAPHHARTPTGGSIRPPALLPVPAAGALLHMFV